MQWIARPEMQWIALAGGRLMFFKKDAYNQIIVLIATQN
jgi:hypothetical protein